MTDAAEEPSIPDAPRGREALEQLRSMVRLLESAEVLMQHARRSRDAAQAAVLRRRAERRRQDAAQLRAQLPEGEHLSPRLPAPGTALRSRPVS